VKLTQRTVGAMALPQGKAEVIHFDDALPGFGLRLRGTTRTWIVQYKIGRQHRRMTIGTTAKCSLDEARAEARGILAKVLQGRDPQREKRETVAALADRCEPHMRDYLARQRTKVRASTCVRDEHHLLEHWKPLHALPITKIDRRTIAMQLSKLVTERGPAAADRARAVLSAFFTWVIKEGIVEANPVVATNRPYEPKARERVLDKAELARIWRACDDSSYGAVVKLLMLTGCRREEIGRLRWSEIDQEAATITLPPERVKNGCAHTIPLSQPALALIQTRPVLAGRDPIFGFGAQGLNSWSTSKRDLDARIALDGPIAPWVIHDLRRSAATHMGELGVQPHIIEAILNHVSGHKAGVAGIYNRASYDREKRQALDLWADHLMAAVEGRASNVVALAR
jgi:integrase